MTKAMTILTNGNKVNQFSVFSISINMMNQQYFWAFVIATVVTFVFVNFPSILSIASRLLSFKRFFVPIFKSAFIGAIFSSAFVVYDSRWNDIKFFGANKTMSRFSILMTLRTTIYRAKFLFIRMFFLCNKILFTLGAIINNWRIWFSLELFQSKMMTMQKFSSFIPRFLSASASAQEVFIHV